MPTLYRRCPCACAPVSGCCSAASSITGLLISGPRPGRTSRQACPSHPWQRRCFTRTTPALRDVSAHIEAFAKPSSYPSKQFHGKISSLSRVSRCSYSPPMPPIEQCRINDAVDAPLTPTPKTEIPMPARGNTSQGAFRKKQRASPSVLGCETRPPKVVPRLPP